MKTGARGYHNRRIDAGEFRLQAGNHDVAEDRLAGRDEDSGTEELEDCKIVSGVLDF